MKAKRNFLVSVFSFVLLICCFAPFVACKDDGGKTVVSNTYAVTFKWDNRNYDVLFADKGKTITALPTDPEKHGYTFGGWFTDENCTQAFDETASITANTSVYAKMTANSYTITYEADGGVNPNTTTTFTVENNVIFSDATKEGYAFDGWYDENNVKVERLPVGDYCRNLTLTAKWTPVEYKITYKDLNGVDNSKNKSTFTVEDGELQIENLADTLDYEFKGWSFMNASPQKDFAFDTVPTFDVTLVAVWEQKEQFKGLDYYVSADGGKVIIAGVTDVTLKNVTVPDETVMILKGAFKNLTSLKSISLPFVGKERTVSDDSTLSYLFDGEIPTSLKTVIITGGETIPESAFGKCKYIENVIITGNVTTIEEYAFYNCTELEMLDIRANVTEIGKYAFYNCENLFQVKLPSSLTVIKSYAFNYCESLIEIYNPSQIEIELGAHNNGRIAEYAKYIYTSLDAESRLYYDEKGNLFYNSEEGLTLLGYKSEDTEYVVPSNVEIIYDSAFSGRKDLTNVTLPANLRIIGDGAFKDCNGIVSLNIEKDGLVVGNNAFNGSTALTKVTISAQNVSIGNSAFKNCSNLSDITLTGKGLKVGNEAFSGCKQQSSLNVSVEGAEFGSAFKGWNELKTLTISANGSKFTDTFMGTSLESVTINGNDVTLNARVFEGISTLRSVTFAGNNIVLGNNDNFKNCTGLTDVSFKGKVTSIGGYNFYYCTSLKTVTFNSGLISIGEGAFEGCSALESISFNDDLTTIGNKAFAGCSKLTKLEFPLMLENIGNSAFEGLNLLYKIELPESLKQIGEKAFAECKHLRQVEFPDGISVGNEAFSGCVLSELFLPKNIIYTNTSFKNCCNDNVAIVYSYGTSDEIKSASDLGLGGGSRLYYYNENPQYNSNNSAFLEDYWHYNTSNNVETGDSKKVTFGTSYNRSPNSGSSIDTLFDDKKSEDGLYIVHVNSIANQVSIIIWLSRSVALKSFAITTGRGESYPNRVPYGFKLEGSTMDGGSLTIVDRYADSTALPKKNYESVTFNGQADGSTLLNTLTFTFAMPQNHDDQNNMELAEIELEFWPIGWNDITAKSLSYKAIDGNGTFVFATDNNTNTSWDVTFTAGGSTEIVLESDEAIALNSYILDFGDGYNPYCWSIYGSNDERYFDGDDKWSLLTKVTDAYVKNQKVYYQLENNTAKYKYYKFLFTDPYERSRYPVRLKEIQISTETKALIKYEAIQGTAGTKEAENYTKVVDGDDKTKWCVSVSTNKKVYVIIKTEIPAILKKVTITTANDTASYPERNPIAFSLGVTDLDSCTSESFNSWQGMQALHSVSDMGLTADNYKEFSYQATYNTEAYQYYRFEFTANSEATLMQIAEITLELAYPD